MTKRLKDTVIHSRERIDLELLDTNTYVSTDNLLQDKYGKTKSSGLPPNGKTVTKFSKNDILIANIRPYLKKLWLADHDGGNSADVITLKVKKGYAPTFIYYALYRDIFFKHMMNGAKGTKMPRGDKKQILDFPIPDYKLSYQEKISKILSSFDKKIEVNKKINSELQSLIKLIYDFWFIQYNYPNESSLPYKESGGKMQHSEDLDGKIPYGWNVDSISSLISTDKNGDWGKAEEEGNYVKKVYCIRGTDLPGLNGFEKIDAPVRYILEKNANKILEDGDVILEMSGGSPTQSTGRLSYTTQHTLDRFDNPLVCSNFCKAIKLKNRSFLFNFINMWNRLYSEGVFFSWESKTSGIKNLLFDSFVNEYKIAIPPQTLINKFYQKVSPIDKLIQTNLKENVELERLRDFLLPLLMNGQVTVKEAEEELDIAAEPDTEYIATKKPTNVDFYRRTVLAAEIVWQLHRQPTLGHVKLQKIIYMAQQSSNMVLPTNFVKQAAGPYDPQMARSLDKHFKQKKWFEFQKGEFLKYKPLEKAGEHQTDFDKYFHEEKENIQFLIDSFKKAKTAKVEIIATLYACWKELIEEGKTVTDDLLIEQFYDWSEEKARFKQARLEKAINWMRDKGVYPVS